jgi:hypothetical protein
MLVSERLRGDQARLEQIRRGLYILTQAAIDKQILSLDSEEFEELCRNNFRLLPPDDVRKQAIELTKLLESAHTRAETAQLFRYEPQPAPGRMRATHELYVLTGLAPPKPPVSDVLDDAEVLAAQTSWAARRTAIYLCGKMDPGKLTPALRTLLLNTLTKDTDASHRLEAMTQLRPALLFALGRDPEALISAETDSRVLTAFLSCLGAVEDWEFRERAASAILALLLRKHSMLNASSQETALRLLAKFTERDIVDDLLRWLPPGASEAVEKAAFESITAIAAKFDVDIADRILSDKDVLRSFLGEPGKAREAYDARAFAASLGFGKF